MMDAAHDLSITIAIITMIRNEPPLSPYMMVQDTMTSITDRLTIPKGFVFPIRCSFQISVPSTWGVTGPTFPTGNLVFI